MADCSSLTGLILLLCSVATCYATVSFSSLNPTLIVTATPQAGQVLKAGEDAITISWSYNSSFPAGSDSSYQMVKIMMCYAPISQKDRGWRKTEDQLNQDKTCQHKIVSRPYSRSSNNFSYMVQKDVPTATYFIRAYALDSHGEQVAYGQTTNAHKTTNLFDVQAISGRHVSLDIASACFSTFSVLSLFGFFLMEKRKAKLQSK